MQIQLITEKLHDQVSIHLQDINLQLEAQGIPARIVEAEAYSDMGLLAMLDVLYSGGDHHLLVNNCTSSQVNAVIQWQADFEEGTTEDLRIYLARK